MAEPLTQGEKQVVFDDIKKEIARIEALIKQKKVSGAALDLVEEKKSMLQQQLDLLLKRGGIITEDDYNKTYNIIRAKEQKELLDLRDKAKRRLIMWGLLGVGIIVVYVLLVKKKSNE
jgi:hypothetical protein